MKTGRTLCLLASVGTTAAFLFPFPANNKAGEKNGRPVETRNIQADKWMTPDTPAFDFKASLQQVVFQIDDMIQDTFSPLQDMFNFSAIGLPSFDAMAPPKGEQSSVMAAAGSAVLESPAAEARSTRRWADTARPSSGKPPKRDDEDEEPEVVNKLPDGSPDSLVDRGVQAMEVDIVVPPAGVTVAEPAKRVSRWRAEEDRRARKTAPRATLELNSIASAVAPMAAASPVEVPVEVVASLPVEPVSEVQEVVMEEEADPWVLPLLDDGYSPIVIPADAFPPRKLELALPLLPEDDKVEEQAAPVMEDEPSIVFTTTPEPVVEEAAPVVTMAAPVVEEEKPVELEAPKPVIMDVHAAAKAAAVAAATPRAPVAPRVVQPVVRPETPAVVRPDIAALLTGDTVIYTPRKSVEDILVESKMQAVEEYHRAKTEDKKMSFEEKVALLEDKLLEEIHTTPSDAANPTVPEFIEVLERVGEQQRKTKQTATAEGSWELVYSTTPRHSYLSLPKWLSKYMTSFDCDVQMDAKSIMYRVVFRIVNWLPAITCRQFGTLDSVNGRKTLETLNRPTFTMGKLNLSKLFPFRMLFNNKKKNQQKTDEQRISNDCTFLGDNLRICRITPVPIFGGEETLAVFARRQPEAELTHRAVEAIKATKAIEPISKLFAKFGRRNKKNNNGPQYAL